MIQEAIASFGYYLILGLIGIGPTLSLIPSTRKNFCSALSFSPAIGLCIVSIFMYPLYRYIGPLVVWNKQFIVVLVFCSLIISFMIWKKGRGFNLKCLFEKNTIIACSALIICWITLALPFILGGMNYGHFGGNPDDAFYYMSQAESFKTVPWKLHYYTYEYPFNHPENIRIATISPTSLYSVRFLHQGVRLATTLSLASAADIFNLHIYRLYGLFPIIYILCAFGLVFAIAATFNFRVESLLGLLPAISIGYWPMFITRNDSLSQISYLPIIILILFAFINTSKDPIRWYSAQKVLLSVSITALIVNYIEALPILVTWFGIFYFWEILRDRSKWRHIIRHIVTIGIVLVLLMLTDQLNNYFTLFIAQSKLVMTKVRFGRFNFVDVRTFGLWNTIWGIVPLIRTAIELLPARKEFILGLSQFFSVCFLVLGAGGLFAIFKNTGKLHVRIILSHLVAGCLLMLYFLWSWHWKAYRAHSKMLFFIVHPIALILFTMTPQYFASLSQKAWIKILLHRIGYTFFGAWIIIQLIVGVLPVIDTAVNRSKLVSPDLSNPDSRNFNVDNIIAHLKNNLPQQLVVDVPSDKEWHYPLYCIFAFAEFKPYYRQGIIYDNRVNSTVKTLPPKVKPDWIVTTPEGAKTTYQNDKTIISNGSLVLLKKVTPTGED